MRAIVAPRRHVPRETSLRPRSTSVTSTPASNRRSPHEHLSRRAAVPTRSAHPRGRCRLRCGLGAVAGLALTPMNGAQHLIWHGPRSPVRSAATILLSGVIIVPLRRKDDHLDTLHSLITESEDPVAVRWRRTLHLCALGVAAVAGFLGCVVIHQATSGEHVALGLPTVGGGQEQMLWAFVPAAAALQSPRSSPPDSRCWAGGSMRCRHRHGCSPCSPRWPSPSSRRSSRRPDSPDTSRCRRSPPSSTTAHG